jgi:hypothetical protein
MGDISVVYYFIDVSGQEVALNVEPADYHACGEPNVAGPFLSSGSAIDWRDKFCPEGQCLTKPGDDPNTCTTSPIYSEDGSWVRGDS